MLLMLILVCLRLKLLLMIMLRMDQGPARPAWYCITSAFCVSMNLNFSPISNPVATVCRVVALFAP